MKHIRTPYQEYYSDSYKTSTSHDINEKSAQIIRSRLSHIPFTPNARVLDVACGISTLGKTFSNNVYGFDINSESEKIAKKNGITFIYGNVEKKWNYPSNYFDIVIASHIIEHVRNPDFLVLEAKRVLKKGGILIIGTPNLSAWFNRIFLLFGIQPFFTEVSTFDKTLGLKFTRIFTPSRNPLGHLRLFTYGALYDLLEFHDFSVTKSVGLEFLPFPAPLLLLDTLISRIVTLSSTLILVSKKN